MANKKAITNRKITVFPTVIFALVLGIAAISEAETMKKEGLKVGKGEADNTNEVLNKALSDRSK